MEFTAKQEDVIDLLAQGMTQDEVAVFAAVETRDIVKWSKDPAFSDEVTSRAVKSAHFSLSLMKGTVVKCVKVLTRTLDEALASKKPIPPAVQKTALAIIDRVAGTGGLVITATTGSSEGGQIQINFSTNGDEDVNP